MNREFWNERYGEVEFAYGKEPNDFLKTQTFKPGGNIICLAEGQGRNAVFLAEKGYHVTSMDYSEEGVEKTIALAKEKGVTVNAICADLGEFDLGENQWDGIVIIFGHFPADLRKVVHGNLFKALKAGGKVVIEAYHKDQLQNKTGGPQTTAMLYNRGELMEDLKAFNQIEIKEVTRSVVEGKYHFGQAAVVQVIAKK